MYHVMSRGDRREDIFLGGVTYDDAGNTKVEALPAPAISPTTASPDLYDFENRLVNRNNGQVQLVYDGDGNRVQETGSGATTYYVVDDQNPTGYAQVLEEQVTVNLPATNSFTYDSNGNLTYDGNRALDYDDENELIRVSVTNNWKSEFTYDGKLRRRIRKEFLWQNGGWALSNEVHYIYDGNLVLQERDANDVPTASYTRGIDLSGSLEGAGGIGGLLARTDHSTITPQHAFYHADGNGNVTMLINSLQLVVAKYLYDPFGGTLSLSGPLPDVNLYRFSSREACLGAHKAG